MHKLKRLLCVFLSMALILSLCGIEASAASKPKLNKTSIVMIKGSTTTLKVTPSGSSVKWSSSDSSVCSVSKSGKLSAKKAGSAKICAKVGSTKLYCKVKVVKSYISSASDISLKAGEKSTFTLKCCNVSSVSVSSTDNSIVKVKKCSLSNNKIKVTVQGVSAGTAFIKVTDKNNKSASVKVKVSVADAKKQDDSSNITSYYVSNGDGTGTLYYIEDDSDLEEYDSSSQNTDSSVSSSDDYAQQVLEIVNKERAAVGEAPLVLDETLCAAADLRAKEISQSFSHTRPDGRECFTVLDEYGVNYYACGENIAYGTSTSSGVMDMWMNSPGHRGNILSSKYGRLGVGYDSSSRSWVQLFTN